MEEILLALHVKSFSSLPSPSVEKSYMRTWEPQHIDHVLSVC